MIARAADRDTGTCAFLFLGETLLIPHLYPIVEALAAAAPALTLDLWVATSVHEALLAEWHAAGGLGTRVRIRRAPGYRALPQLARGENPPLPPKLPTLLRLLPHLLGARAVVCAEQTSLWLPRLFPFLRLRFVKAAHGAGSLMNRADPRRRAAARLLVPAMQERERLVALGLDPARVDVVGYVKRDFRWRTPARTLFADDRPVVLYAPHWQRKRSSWWQWGSALVEMLARQTAWNVILAPHQRLFEAAPEARDVLAAAAGQSHVHADFGSFAGVDGSYLAAADIYLGDTSSQVVEFLAQPRPCVFLNPDRIDWRATGEHQFWACGEVVSALDTVERALAAAPGRHAEFVAEQRAFALRYLGDPAPPPAERAAAAVIATLR